ncbi:MAG: putative rRNA maturation factor [Candidatus Tokpelaia sp. JSC188]|nr:MAG: putative rRNA maturation factor [Candidatus Tokpelaia sp. JSC188]
MITIDIAVHDKSWMDKKSLKKLVTEIVEVTLKRLSMQHISSELSLVFTNNAEICYLNSAWRSQGKATNVLSFPAFPIKIGGKVGPMLGDIILARETIEQEATKQRKPFIHHLSHLIVHGFLHLLGYDHENDTDAAIMETIEQEIVKILAIPDPYTVSALD